MGNGRRNNQLIEALALAILAAWGTVRLGVMIGSASSMVVVALFSFAVYAVWFVYLGQRRYELRAWVVSCVFGFVFSFALAIGVNLTHTGTSLIAHVGTWLTMVMFAPVPASVLLGVSALLFDAPLHPGCPCKAGGVFRPMARFGSLGARTYFLLAWALIIGIWLVAYLGAFPGHYGYDAIYQLIGYNAGAMTDQHPLLHNLYLGFCISTLGRDCLGSAQAGMVIYCMSQMAMMSAIYAYIACRLRDMAGVGLSVLMVAASALLPYNAILSFSTTKDSLFGAVFALAVFLTFEFMVSVRAHRSLTVRWWIIYTVVLVACCLLRNNALCAIVAAALVGVISIRGKRVRVALSCAVVIAVVGVVNGPVGRLAGVTKLGSREMMSLPAQQMARSVKWQSESLTPDQVEGIAAFFPSYIKYQARIADPVKCEFNESLYRDHKDAFWRLWFEVGRACPAQYLDAFLIANDASWNLDSVFPLAEGYHPYLEFGPEYKDMRIVYERSLRGPNAPYTMFVEQHPISRSINKWLSDYAAGGFQRVPVLHLLSMQSLGIWVILGCAALLIIRRDYLLLGPLLLAFFYWGTLLLGPIALFRYLYGVMAALPVFFATIAIARRGV